MDLKTELRNLEKAKTNRVALFGEAYVELVQKIDKQTWESRKPLGPVGAYVSIKDPKYQRSIETCLVR